MTHPATDPATATTPDEDWWRTAVVYQVYPRSFADSDGDVNGAHSGLNSPIHHLNLL